MEKIPLFIISSSPIVKEYKYFSPVIIKKEDDVPFSSYVKNIKGKNLPLCLVIDDSLIMLSEEKVLEVINTNGWSSLYLYRYNDNCHRQKIMSNNLVVPYNKENYLAVALKNNKDNVLATPYNLFAYNTIQVDDIKKYDHTNMCITDKQIVSWPSTACDISYNPLSYVFYIFVILLIVYLFYRLRKK